METTITTLNFYPNRYWFWYFKKFTYIKGFTIRIFGINIMVKEKDSLKKLMHVAEIHKICKMNNIKYK